MILAYVAGLINRELLLKSGFLATQLKIAKGQSKTRPRLSDEEERRLAKIVVQLGRKLLAEIESIVTRETTFGWYRELVAKKFDGSQKRQSQGRPPTEEELETLVVRSARENRSWGYRRIVGAFANVDHAISHQTVVNILDCFGTVQCGERLGGLLRLYYRAA